jgi:hypothetical protein
MTEKGGIYIVLLEGIGKLIPGTYLKTFVYLNFISATRKFLRKSIGSFYRGDHVYDVLKEFKKGCKGNFSILEFGVADGYSFTKKLYATRYLKMEERVMVHGFDTFEGLPGSDIPEDSSLVVGCEWTKSHYKGRFENLSEYCRSKYKNFSLHKGLFEETITDDFLETLKDLPPILIWVDCDYYSSTRVIFERLIPYIPTGCVIYFDDIYFNFSSRFTGEMKAVWEINHGKFGEGIELVLDSALSWDSNRIYRFINMNQKRGFELTNPKTKDPVRLRRDDSPLP